MKHHLVYNTKFIVLLLLSSTAAIAQSKPDSIYFGKDVATKPEFIGGATAMQQFMLENIKYPTDALNAGVKGRVFIGFVVNKDGMLSEIKVNKSLSPGLDTAAFELVKKMPAWKPATKDGAAVRCRMGMPITFDGLSKQDRDSLNELNTTPEIPAVFPGGASAMEKFINSHLQYPESSKRNNITGKVYVQFIIEKDGSIINVDVIKSPDEATKAEAVRVISMMPKWKPGMTKGNPVRTRFVVPVGFRLK